MHRTISYEIPRSAALSIRPAQEPNVAADIEPVAGVRLQALRTNQRVDSGAGVRVRMAEVARQPNFSSIGAAY